MPPEISALAFITVSTLLLPRPIQATTLIPQPESLRETKVAQVSSTEITIFTLPPSFPSLDGDIYFGTLAEIALKLAQAGRYDQARQFAQTLTDSSEKATTLVDIAVIAATAGQYDQARQIAEAIANDSYKVLTLANIASQEIKAGQTDKASQILDRALGIIPSLSCSECI